MDLVNDINLLSNQLSSSIKIMARYGKELAYAEREYKITLNQIALKLRAEKNMPVTLIDKVIYGHKEVAEKRLKRDIASTMYETAKENVNVIKLRLRLMESQLQREWSLNS